MALDLGAMTVFLYTFTEREKIYNLFELLTGARFTTSYTRVGGQIRDLPADVLSRSSKKFLDGFIPQLDEIDNLLTRNRIFVDRTRDIGVISEGTRDRLRALRPESARQRRRARSAAASIRISTTRNTTSTSRSAPPATATIATSSAWKRCGRACASCGR